MQIEAYIYIYIRYSRGLVRDRRDTGGLFFLFPFNKGKKCRARLRERKASPRSICGFALAPLSPAPFLFSSRAARRVNSGLFKSRIHESSDRPCGLSQMRRQLPYFFPFSLEGLREWEGPNAKHSIIFHWRIEPAFRDATIARNLFAGPCRLYAPSRDAVFM